MNPLRNLMLSLRGRAWIYVACLAALCILLVVIFNAGPGTSHPHQTTPSASATTQTPVTTVTPTTTAPSDTDWFPGNWTTVVCDGLGKPGEIMYFVNEITYSFSPDGTGTINDMGWVGNPGSGWEVAGMGFVETYFSYTLEGDTIIITHTGSEFEEYPEQDRETNFYTIVRNDDGSVTWIDEIRKDSKIYRQKVSYQTVDELLELFGLALQ